MYIVSVIVFFFAPYVYKPQWQFVNKKTEAILYWDENAILPTDFSVKHPHCLIECNSPNGS